MVHVCLRVIFVAALKDTYTQTITRLQIHENTPHLCAFFQTYLNTFFPSVYLERGQLSAVKMKEYQGAYRQTCKCVS